MSNIALVLERDRRFRGVVIRQAQQNDFGPVTNSVQNLGDALGLLEIVEAPMKIDDFLVSARLVRLIGGEFDQFVTQRGKAVGLLEPDDDIEGKARNGAPLSIKGNNWRYASGKPGSGLSKLSAASSPSGA